MPWIVDQMAHVYTLLSKSADISTFILCQKKRISGFSAAWGISKCTVLKSQTLNWNRVLEGTREIKDKAKPMDKRNSKITLYKKVYDFLVNTI